MRKLLTILRLAPRNALCSVITLYQATASPDHGPLRHLYPYGFCRHHPTCSVYAKQVILKNGVFIGMALASARVFCCNPWAKLSDEKLRDLAVKASQ